MAITEMIGYTHVWAQHPARTANFVHHWHRHVHVHVSLILYYTSCLIRSLVQRRRLKLWHAVVIVSLSCPLIFLTKHLQIYLTNRSVFADGYRWLCGRVLQTVITGISIVMLALYYWYKLVIMSRQSNKVESVITHVLYHSLSLPTVHMNLHY